MHKSVVCLLSRAFLPLFILGPPSGQMLSHHLGWDPRQQDFGIGKLLVTSFHTQESWVDCEPGVLTPPHHRRLVPVRAFVDH